MLREHFYRILGRLSLGINNFSANTSSFIGLFEPELPEEKKESETSE